MKNVLLVFVFLFAAQVSFGQATPCPKYRIANSTTVLGVNMSVGTQVFDVANQKLYVAIRAVPSTVTLATGLADANPYFKEMGRSILSMKFLPGNMSIGGTLYAGSTVNGSYACCDRPGARYA